jgi:hypothetical protein
LFQPVGYQGPVRGLDTPTKANLALRFAHLPNFQLFWQTRPLNVNKVEARWYYLEQKRQDQVTHY